MISLVVLAIAIISMLLFSQPTPQKIPNINFMTGSDNSNNLYLYHNGGDTLKQGDFSVLVDGTIKPYTISGGGNEWSLGQNLILTGVPSGAHNVAIIYNATGSGGVVLRSASSSVIAASVTTNPDALSRTTYPPVISVSQLMQNMTNNSVNYYQEGGMQILSGSIQFNITKINSTIFYTPSAASSPVMVPLAIGNNVAITPFVGSGFSPGVRAFGIGDQIWELTAEKATLSITNRSGGDLNLGAVAINNTWVTGYKDLRSTLAISGSPGTYNIELVVNRYPSDAKSQTFSSQIWNRTTTAVTTTINNVGPTTTGIFVLQHDNRTKSMYFVGSGTVT